MLRQIALLVLAASSASAHFLLNYPTSRGDSYNTQFQFPCGGLPRGERYAWPTTGGAISISPLHAFAFTTVNIALGDHITETTDVNSFNHIMRPTFNQTGGNGTFCIPKVKIPKVLLPYIAAGVNATIQVVQQLAGGASLYNCADITFSDTEANRFGNPAIWDEFCFNSTGMSATYLGDPNAAINYTELALQVRAMSAAPRSIDASRIVMLAGLLVAVWSLW